MPCRLDFLLAALMSSWRGFGCCPLSCVSYGSAPVVLPGASPSFHCHPFSLPLYSPSSVRGLALGAELAALHTLGEIAPAPLFPAAFFYLSWLWLPFLLALRCIFLSYASALLSLFLFLLPGVFLRLSSVGLWSPPLPCAALHFSLSFGLVVYASPFSFQSLSALLPRSNLRSPRVGVRPLGRVSNLLGFLSSFSFLVPRLPFGTVELVVVCFSPSLSLVFVPLFRWVLSSWGSMLLVFRGFSRLRFGLCAFFVLLWFSLAVFRVGPSPALSSVSVFFRRFFTDVVLCWSPFTFLPVGPCSPCFGRFLFLWHLFSFAWASGLLFGSSACFLVAFSVFGVLRASFSVLTSCLP